MGEVWAETPAPNWMQLGNLVGTRAWLPWMHVLLALSETVPYLSYYPLLFNRFKDAVLWL